MPYAALCISKFVLSLAQAAAINSYIYKLVDKTKHDAEKVKKPNSSIPTA
jgi:hypothetical protein